MNALFSALAPYIVPTVIIVVGYFYHHFARYIPAQQRAYIETFAKNAVAYAEQKGIGLTNAEKKQMAMDAIVGFLKAFNLPIPPLDVLSAFIEAAVSALPKSPLQGNSIDPHMAIDITKRQSK